MDDALREAIDKGEWIEGEARKQYDEAIIRCAQKVYMYNTTAMQTIQQIQDAIDDITESKVDRTSLVLFPFRCDLGFNVRIGKNVIVNYNCTFLDTAPITLGDNTKIGPDCHLVTADHPRDHVERREHRVRGKPITIGDDCWLGANVTILPGVTVGNRCIIGAGSVVTKDVPDNEIWVGNPAHPIDK